MTVTREFLSNFTKIKRTPMLLLHLLTPIVITALFLLYYGSAGYRIIPDVRSFFLLLQIGCPIFASMAVSIFIHLDRNINGLQNALGLVESRKCVYLGKLFFLLFLSAVNVILYEVCFYIGVNWFLNSSIIHFDFYLAVFCIFLFCSLFLYLLHMAAAFRFGSSVSVLLGVSGTILAGIFENPMGDKIWTAIPWEWGVRFLKECMNVSGIPVFFEVVLPIIITLAILVLTTLWFDRWEGKVTQE